VNHNIDGSINTRIELADYAVSRCPNLRGQLEHVEAQEVLQIFCGFVEEASADGCAAAAFRVLKVALEHSADRVLMETQSEVVQ
jgi:hypothetical protein